MEVKDREEGIIAGLGADTRNLRDIFLVFDALDYGCGLFVQSLYALMNDIVLNDIVNIQYFVGRFPLAVASSSVFVVNRHVKAVPIVAPIVLFIVLVATFIDSLPGNLPFVGIVSVALLIMFTPALLAMPISNLVHGRPESFLGFSTKRLREIADKIGN